MTHFAIASDDYSKILIFEHGNPNSVGDFSFDSVTDIEAAARIGDTAIWVTSHSLTSNKKKDKPERKVVFATTIKPEVGLVATGVTYDSKLRTLVSQGLDLAEPDLMPRFNIEGVTESAEKTLFVGLRGPLHSPDDTAFLVEIANPLAMVGLGSDGAVPTVIRRIELDLSDGPGTEGRGVRDMARVGNRYLILAGAEPDGGDPPPKLFWWDGSNKAEGVSTGPDADFTGMSPEAIVVWDAHSAEIFSDDGDAFIDGIKCKDDETLPPNAGFSALDVKF